MTWNDDDDAMWAITKSAHGQDCIQCADAAELAVEAARITGDASAEFTNEDHSATVHRAIAVLMREA